MKEHDKYSDKKNTANAKFAVFYMHAIYSLSFSPLAASITF